MYAVNLTIYAQWEVNEITIIPTCSISTSGTIVSSSTNWIKMRAGWGTGASVTMQTTVDTTGWSTITIDAFSTGETKGYASYSVYGYKDGTIVCSSGGSGNGREFSGVTLDLNSATEVRVMYYGQAYEGGDGYDGPYYCLATIGSITLSK